MTAVGNNVAIRITLEGGAKATVEASQVGAAVSGIGKAAGASADGASRLVDSLRRVGHYGLAGSALYGVANAVKEASKALFDASVAGERLATALNFATGGNAVREMAFLRDLTDRLGLGFNDSAKAFAGFAAAARGTSLEGQGARDVFEGVAKAAATMGLSADDTRGVLLALQQMLSKGTVQAEELRGQLGERLPGAFAAAARAMGKTEAEFGKMLERGEVAATELLPKLAKALNEDFGKAAEDASKRLAAASANLDNAWERFKKTLGDSGPSSGTGWFLGSLAQDFNAMADAMRVAEARGGNMATQWLAALTTFRTLPQQISAAEAEVAQFEATLTRAAEAGRDLPNQVVVTFGLEAARKKLLDLKRLRDEVYGAKGPTSGDEARTAAFAADQDRPKKEQMAREEALAKARTFYKSDLAIRQEWAAKAVALTQAYSNAIAKAIDPAQQEQLRAEMLAAARALTIGLDKELAAAAKGLAPDFSIANARAAADQQAFADSVAAATQDLQTSIAENERLYKLGLRGLNDYVTLKYGLEQDLLDNEARVIESRIALAERRATATGAERIDQQREIDALRAELARVQAKKASAATPQQELTDRAALDRQRAEQEEEAEQFRAQDALNEQARQQVRQRREAALGSVTATIEANRVGNIALIRDDRARGEAQIALFREQELAKIKFLESEPEEYARAQEAINEAVRIKHAELTESLKPEWQRMLEGWQDTAKLMQQAMDNAMTGTLKGAEDAFVSLVTTGKANLKSLANVAIAEFARAQFRQAMAGLVKWAASAFGPSNTQGAGGDAVKNALGGVFSPGGRLAFAAGGVVTGPTNFRFAQGGALRKGLMGEAGPEAIMPLRRAADGSLGVVAQGGSGATYNITVAGDATTNTVRMIETALAKYDRQRRQRGD